MQIYEEIRLQKNEERFEEMNKFPWKLPHYSHVFTYSILQKEMIGFWPFISFFIF